MRACPRQHSERAGKSQEDVPTARVRNGRPIQRELDRRRVDMRDVMESARLLEGVERAEEIRCAILERTGEIAIIRRSRRGS